MDFLSRGHMLADVSGMLGSLDIVLCEIDCLLAGPFAFDATGIGSRAGKLIGVPRAKHAG